MFRTVPLSIIRNFSLYTQQWYVIQVLLTACEPDQDGTSLSCSLRDPLPAETNSYLYCRFQIVLLSNRKSGFSSRVHWLGLEAKLSTNTSFVPALTQMEQHTSTHPYTFLVWCIFKHIDRSNFTTPTTAKTAFFVIFPYIVLCCKRQTLGLLNRYYMQYLNAASAKICAFFVLRFCVMNYATTLPHPF